MFKISLICFVIFKICDQLVLAGTAIPRLGLQAKVPWSRTARFKTLPIRRGGGSDSSPLTNITSSPKSFDIIDERVVYKGWRSILKRIVRMNNGREVDFDIVDPIGVGAVAIFAWCSKSKTATLIREYHPGCARVLLGPAAGIIESCPSKHDSDPTTAAKLELEEECHLRGGTWYRLVNEHVSVPIDKYDTTEITAFLVVDAERVQNPPALDLEEDIDIVPGVDITTIKSLILSGHFNIVGGWTCMLAIAKLEELGEITH